MLHKRSLVLLVLIAVFSLAGCGTTRQGPGEVAKKWSCKLREMQIRPIFPPREDVHVGDVYWLPHANSKAPAPDSARDDDAAAYCHGSSEDGFMKIGSHLAFVSQVGVALEAHYGSRPSLPASGSSSISISGKPDEGLVLSASSRTTAPTENASLFNGGVANRTRLVAFPDFMAVDVDQANFGAIGTVSGLPFSLTRAVKATESVRISIPVAESYGLPLLPLISAVQRSLTSTTSLCSSSVTAVLVADFHDQDKGAIHVVQEVFYARAMDIDMSVEQASALGIGADTGSSATASSPGAFTTPGIASSDPSGSHSVATQVAAAVRAALDQMELRGGLPGVTVNRSSAHLGRIHLRRLFDRPVAIGMRSAVLKLDPGKQRACLVSVAPDAGNGTAAAPMSSPPEPARKE